LSPNRSSILKKLLGGDKKYQETRSLVHTIQTVKLQQVVSLKGCCSNGAMACRPTATITSPPPIQSKFSGQFPSHVKQLFFHTPLVHAFEKTPIHKLSNLDWPQMVQQAQRNLHDFQEYTSIPASVE
jgi:hypothetical protein